MKAQAQLGKERDDELDHARELSFVFCCLMTIL